MKTSARNQFSGKIVDIVHGSVNCEVEVVLPGGQHIIAAITEESCKHLELEIGQIVVLLVKSSSIVVATDLDHIKLSARNQIDGIISHVERGAVNSIITIDLGGDVSLTAGITMQSAENLELRPGQKATAVFKAGNVILGVLV